jgi:hypothetical protein
MYPPQSELDVRGTYLIGHDVLFASASVTMSSSSVGTTQQLACGSCRLELLGQVLDPPW